MTAAALAPIPTDDGAKARIDRERATLAAILLASFLLYAPSLANDFTWDDRHAAMGSGPTAHPLIASLHPLGDYFASNWWPHYLPGWHEYRPLTTFFFALRHAVCGDHAVVAHAANILLHTLAVGLCYVLMRRLALPFAAAALGAGVFGLHAIHSEATANVVGAAELLALVFGLGATLLLLSATASCTRRRFALQYPLAALALFAAAASKESGLAWCAFAPLCVLAAHWRGAVRRPRRADWVAIVAVLIVPAVAYLQCRAGMLARLPADAPGPGGLLVNPLLELPTCHRLASGFLAWAYGAWLVAAPFDLAVDYGPDQLPVVRDLASPWGLASIAVAIVFTFTVATATLRARQQPLLALAVACFCGFTFVVTNVPFAIFMHFGERTYTTPSLALAIAVAAAAARPLPKHLRRIGAAAVACWLVASVATALPRNLTWADDATLVARELASSPRSARMQLSAGAMATRRGQFAAARACFERAAELAPMLPQPWIELATLALREGRIAEAQAFADRAHATSPGEQARCDSALRTLRQRLDATRSKPAPR